MGLAFWILTLWRNLAWTTKTLPEILSPTWLFESSTSWTKICPPTVASAAQWTSRIHGAYPIVGPFLLAQFSSLDLQFFWSRYSMMGALSISIAYGIDVNLKNDPNIHYAEEAVKGLAGAANFGAFLVNSIPMLRYVPSWFPGAAWKRKAHVWNDWTSKMREIPFQQSLKQLVSSSHISRSPVASFWTPFIDCDFDRCITQAEGTATPSLVMNSIYGIKETQDREHQMTVIKDTAGNFFVGTKIKPLTPLTFIWCLFQGALIQLYQLLVHFSWWWYATRKSKRRLKQNLITLSGKAIYLIMVTRQTYLTSVHSWRKPSGTKAIFDRDEFMEFFHVRFQAITPLGIFQFVKRHSATDGCILQLSPIIWRRMMSTTVILSQVDLLYLGMSGSQIPPWPYKDRQPRLSGQLHTTRRIIRSPLSSNQNDSWRMANWIPLSVNLPPLSGLVAGESQVLWVRWRGRVPPYAYPPICRWEKCWSKDMLIMNM